MKKILAVFLALATTATVVFLSPACSVLTGGSVETPAQIAAQVCPPLQAALGVLNTSAGLSKTASDDLAKAVPIIGAVCGGAATVNVSSIQSLLSSGMPLVVSVLQMAGVAANSPVMVDLTIATAILQSVLDSIAAGQPPAPKPVVATAKYRVGMPGYICYTAESGKLPTCAAPLQ